MLTFYRTKDCPGCQDIESILKDMAIAHEVVIVDLNEKNSRGVPEGKKIPLLIDEGKVIEGSKDIVAYLERFEKYKQLWYKYQSDVCYCDDDEIEPL